MLESVTFMPCAEAASALGIEQVLLVELPSLVTKGAAQAFALKENVTTTEMTDGKIISVGRTDSGVTNPGTESESDLVEAAASEQYGGDVTNGMRFVKSRVCDEVDVEGDGYLYGRFRIYYPNSAPTGNKKYRAWTGKHTAVPQGGSKVWVSAHGLRAAYKDNQNALEDWSPNGFREVGQPITRNYGVQYGGYGVSFSMVEMPPEQGGNPSEGGVGYFAAWKVNDLDRAASNARGVASATMFNGPVNQNLTWVKGCGAGFIG